MRVIIDIPENISQRVLDCVNIMGYVYNPEDPATDAEQRLAFVSELSLQYWQSNVFNYERGLAIANEPNDTAADQAQRWDNVTGLQADKIAVNVTDIEI